MKNYLLILNISLLLSSCVQGASAPATPLCRSTSSSVPDLSKESCCSLPENPDQRVPVYVLPNKPLGSARHLEQLAQQEPSNPPQHLEAEAPQVPQN